MPRRDIAMEGWSLKIQKIQSKPGVSGAMWLNRLGPKFV